MEREVKGRRYLKRSKVKGLEDLVFRDLLYRDFNGTCAFYHNVVHDVPHNGVNRWDRDALAFLGCNDRFYLLSVLCHRRDIVHPWLFLRCREVEAAPDGYVDLWSRFHYKSTIITFGGSIQEVLCDPEITCAIFSVTKSIAHEFLAQIKEEFENNDDLKWIYRDVLYQNPKTHGPDGRPAKWSLARGITVKRRSNPKEASIEAHGLIDGQPTSRHFQLHVYDDVVTQDYLSEDQIKKTTERWEMADNLGSHLGTRKRVAGTRYCTVGSTRILMGDWSHKPIQDVCIGDVIIGWELRDGTRWLKPAKVVNRGIHLRQAVNRYTLENGRSVTCTEDHRWWRGAHGGGPEYAPLGLGKRPLKGRIGHLRELLVPINEDSSKEAGWLAGFFDGEGTINKNAVHPSGCIVITQTAKYPEILHRLESSLAWLGFKWRKKTWVPSNTAGQESWSDRFDYTINGGWRERYRFLAQVSPAKRSRLSETLFGQLKTENVKLDSVARAGEADVYWLETETGNYVAEGFCSSNSFADTYGEIIDRKSLIPRIYPATDDGTLNGTPVFLSVKEWARIKRDQRSVVSAQMLLNPAAGTEATFLTTYLRTYDVFPSLLNVYIMVDPSKGRTQRSDRTAIAVIGIDVNDNKYLLDGYCHRMKLSERYAHVMELHAKWSNYAGCQGMKVGWEQYGMQVDLEVVEDMMIRDRRQIHIEELNTPQQGGHSKDDRIGRLEPDLRGGRFYIPIVVHNPDFGGAGQFAGMSYLRIWTDEANQAWSQINPDDQRVCPYNIGQIIYSPVRGLTRMQRYCESVLERARIVAPIKRRDENGDIYDVTRRFISEMSRHPFAPHDDFIDACSRIYDMDPNAPINIETGATAPIDDGDDPRAQLDS